MCGVLISVGLVGWIRNQYPNGTDRWSVDRGCRPSTEPRHPSKHDPIRPCEGHTQAPVTSPTPRIAQPDTDSESEGPKAYVERRQCNNERAETSDDRQESHKHSERSDTDDGMTNHPVPAESLSLLTTGGILGGLEHSHLPADYYPSSSQTGRL